jgi:excisionase family DNA binding protein
MTELPDFLTVDEVAARLRMGPQGVRRAIRAGRLRARKVGRGYLIDLADLRAYLDALPTTPAPDVTLAGGRTLTREELTRTAPAGDPPQAAGDPPTATGTRQARGPLTPRVIG